MTLSTALSFPELKKVSNELRQDIITMLEKAGSGHPGGSLSAIDLVTYLFYNRIGRTRENGLDPDRHRFVLSKGHGVPALYAVLARLGLIDRDALKTLRQVGSPLQGHPDRVRIPFVEASTGSLGQGLSIAQGLALAARLDQNGAEVYCLLGDGEMQEGQIWEALMSAPKFQLENLYVFLDYNRGQIDGLVQDVMPIEPIKEKIAAFRWDLHVIDGHDFKSIHEAVEKARGKKNTPHFFIANTIKGKGVSFMENRAEWHGQAPNAEQARKALEELKKGA